jgi:hypothetical protein
VELEGPFSRALATWEAYQKEPTTVTGQPPPIAFHALFHKAPAQAILILVTDLFEGGNEAQLVRRLKERIESVQAVRRSGGLPPSSSGSTGFADLALNRTREDAETNWTTQNH